MSEGIIVFALVLAVLLGVGSAAFLVMRSPAFWADAAKQLGAALLPALVKYAIAPEDEATRKARQLCERQGRRWNHAKRRCE